MKRVLILAVLVSVLTGCNAWVNSATINLAQFACKNEGGITSINTFLNTTVTCNSGNMYQVQSSDLKQAYTASLNQRKPVDVE